MSHLHQALKSYPFEWSNSKLEDLVTILDGKRVPINNTERQNRIEGKPDSALFPYYGATGEVGKIDDYIFDEELVALGEDGVPFLDVKKSKAYMLYGKTWVNNHAHVLKAIEGITTNKFILNYLNQFDYYNYVNGGTRLKLTQANMRKIPIPLPPLAEQQQIAAKLDELLAQVDNLKTRLDNIPKILKRFRQSVLAAAVSGKLTEDWREKNTCSSLDSFINNIEVERIYLKSQKKLKRNFGITAQAEPLYESIPATWRWVCFDQISENTDNALKAGPFGSALKKIDCTETGYKVYGQEQVIAGDESLITYFINQAKFDDLKSCKVKSGDILISLVGTIGKILVLTDKSEPGIINPRLVKLSLNNKISRDFIRYYLNSPIAMDFFKGFSHGGTMEILNLGVLRQLPISLPPIEEQTEIVARVEQLFAYADQIEQRVKDAQSRVNHLTQAILSKAFRGELTADWRAQNPELISGENSAEALLARIKSEREQTQAVKKS
jgi:type I restriction enzyme, S subunit